MRINWGTRNRKRYSRRWAEKPNQRFSTWFDGAVVVPTGPVTYWKDDGSGPMEISAEEFAR